MAGLLGTLNTAKSGMAVSQIAIQTTSHNITNIKTPGYSRQRISQTASRPYSQPGGNSSTYAGQIGTGAKVSDITRIRNSFYDYQFRSESHKYGDTSIKYDYYKNMESIFNKPSASEISTSLNSFFNGWDELAKDPESTGAKSVVIENAKYLANTINNVYGKLSSLEESLGSQSESILKEINSMVSEIRDLDKNIKVIEGSGKSPNDLLDERDRILDDLSFKINISDNDVEKIIKDSFDNNGKIKLDDLVNSGIDISGELQGAITMGRELAKYKESLTVFANIITSKVNEVAGQEIFVQSGSKIIGVNQDIDLDLDKLKITGQKASELYDLKNEKVNINGKEMSINTFYNNMVQDLGESSQAVIRDESNQSKLLSDIDKSRSSVSGVSLDEEMINLVQLQHVYNASAKVISTIDSLLDVVVNGLIR